MRVALSKVTMDIVTNDDVDHALRIIKEMNVDAPKDQPVKVEMSTEELQAIAAPLVEEDEDSVIFDDQIPGVLEPVDESKVEEKPKKPRKSRQSPSAKAGHSVMGGGVFNDSKKPAKSNPADAKSAFAADPLDDPVEKVEQPVDDIPFKADMNSKKAEDSDFFPKSGMKYPGPVVDSKEDDIDLTEVKPAPAKVLQMPVKLEKKVFLAKVRDAITHCSSDEVGEILEGISGHRSTRDIHDDHYDEIIIELDALLAKKVAG
ncbi:MAG: hypothetical protein HN867_19575 [Deltaproteobacteria bacterium]|jgi:hypothetical protein|nr:hypothetical protein [Deltaproteobacteria bacterium]